MEDTATAALAAAGCRAERDDNFPPFSVGEVNFLSGPGRREIGHVALAARAASDKAGYVRGTTT